MTPWHKELFVIIIIDVNLKQIFILFFVGISVEAVFSNRYTFFVIVIFGTPSWFSFRRSLIKWGHLHLFVAPVVVYIPPHSQMLFIIKCFLLHFIIYIFLIKPSSTTTPSFIQRRKCQFRRNIIYFMLNITFNDICQDVALHPNTWAITS